MASRPRRVLAVRQLDFKGLGALGTHLQHSGYEIDYLDATRDDLSGVRLDEADLVVILGGPPCALDDMRFPFLLDEMRLIEQCLARDKPLLGICLGAQLIARVLGGTVHRDAAQELGWWPVQLSTAGSHSPLRFLRDVPVLHWHSDAIELPVGIDALASTEQCPIQAFSQGHRILGLQFHPEVDALSMPQWLAAHVAQLDAHPDQSVERLRAESEQCLQWMNQQAGVMLRDWLSHLDEHRLMNSRVSE